MTEDVKRVLTLYHGIVKISAKQRILQMYLATCFTYFEKLRHQKRSGFCRRWGRYDAIIYIKKQCVLALPILYQEHFCVPVFFKGHPVY